ncbi:hypothetical protein RB618_22460, partial [Flavobacterium sp. LHD-85]|nr:hypothetical protein [Flavobacterium sp. LHD-85]
GATSVSNASTANSLTTTVNGVTGAGVNMVNSNASSLSGSSLVTTVNGIASAALDLTPAIAASETTTTLAQSTSTGGITYTNEDGTAQTASVRSSDSGNIITVGTDGGNFINAAVIKANETLTTLVINSTTGTLDYRDEANVLRSLNLSSAVKEPWYSTATNTGATLNTENIYTGGWVGVGFTAPSAVPNEKLRVNGAITTVNSYYADYVFEDYFNGFSKIKKDYKFMLLSDIEEFIKKNKHLPGITPINELEKTKDGYSFNISELSIQLLEKTEEIYLYIIEQNRKMMEQNKEIEAKGMKIKELEKSSEDLNLRLVKLEKIILGNK